MMKNSEKPKAKSGANAVEARAVGALSVRHSSFVIRHSRPGLTLIELLVTIVIMVTVLAGVLPLVSPNNNSRKIREASRQLNTLLSQAQAQAARDGRPAGVAFREFANATSRSGIALEAYAIAVPPTYAGFSESSRAVVNPPALVYGTAGASANGGSSFSPQYNDKPVCTIDLLAFGNVDPFPPRMLRIGDTIQVGANTFLICDDADQAQMPNKVELLGDVEYLLSDPSASAPVPGTTLNAIWTNYVPGMMLPQVPTPPVGQQYKIYRQPVKSSDEPLQFPRGIGIDLEASAPDGIAGFGLPSEFDTPGVVDVISVMFSPNGAIADVYMNDRKLAGVEHIYLLMGLVENGNGNGRGSTDYDFSAAVDDDELALRRSRINWLNADSRWVSVNRAGRVVTAQNNISFDPRLSPYIDDANTDLQRQKQISASRQDARNMTGSSGK